MIVSIDTVGINGGGSNEPTGILQTSGIGSVAIGTNGGAQLGLPLLTTLRKLRLITH